MTLMRAHKISQIEKEYPFHVVVPSTMAIQLISEFYGNETLERRKMNGWSMFANTHCAIYVMPNEHTLLFFKSEEDALMTKLKIA